MVVRATAGEERRITRYFLLSLALHFHRHLETKLPSRVRWKRPARSVARVNVFSLFKSLEQTGTSRFYD